jgi:hypothetical protein
MLMLISMRVLYRIVYTMQTSRFRGQYFMHQVVTMLTVRRVVPEAVAASLSGRRLITPQSSPGIR